MRWINISVAVVCVLSAGCNSGVPTTMKIVVDSAAEKRQIEDLVRRMYKWQETIYPSDRLLTETKDSTYIGVDPDKLRAEIKKLRETGFFSEAFLDNYKNIYLTLNKKLKSKEFEWLVGDLPPFGNDTNPWCACQDYPYDNPWVKIEFKFTSLDSTNADLSWTWGGSEWSKGFDYKVKATKEQGSWKIAYLQGYDFIAFTRKNY